MHLKMVKMVNLFNFFGKIYCTKIISHFQKEDIEYAHKSCSKEKEKEENNHLFVLVLSLIARKAPGITKS